MVFIDYNNVSNVVKSDVIMYRWLLYDSKVFVLLMLYCVFWLLWGCNLMVCWFFDGVIGNEKNLVVGVVDCGIELLGMEMWMLIMFFLNVFIFSWYKFFRIRCWDVFVNEWIK